MLLGVSGIEIIPSPRGDPALFSLLGVRQMERLMDRLAMVMASGVAGLLAFILTPDPQQIGLMGSVSQPPDPDPTPNCPEAEEPPPPPLTQHRYPALSSGLAPAPAVCHRDRFRHAPGGILIPAYPPGCSRGLPARISPLSRGKAYRKTQENRNGGGAGGCAPAWSPHSPAPPLGAGCRGCPSARNGADTVVKTLLDPPQMASHCLEALLVLLRRSSSTPW